MADVNLYYHKQTNSWWTNSTLDGIDLTNYIKENATGLGTVHMDTENKNDIKALNLNEVMSMFIPDWIKKFNGVSKDIEENGLKNAQKVSEKRLKKILKDR